MLNLANFISVLVDVVWYVVVVTTTTCQQLGNDTTYDTEKKNPTSRDVADTSAVSGRRVGKKPRHVVKTNCGWHLKRRHFQLSSTVDTCEILGRTRIWFHFPRPIEEQCGHWSWVNGHLGLISKNGSIINLLICCVWTGKQSWWGSVWPEEQHWPEAVFAGGSNGEDVKGCAGRRIL